MIGDEPAQQPNWYAADKAYQLHHFNCPTCCAAGVSPGRGQRCARGQMLWDSYEQAGIPPHFTWSRNHHEQRPPDPDAGS